MRLPWPACAADVGQNRAASAGGEPKALPIDMRFPVILRYMQTIVIADLAYFARFGRIDLAARVVESTVGKNGDAGYHWMIDADGQLHRLELQGRVRRRWQDWLQLRQMRAAYRIGPPSSVTSAVLRGLLVGLQEPGDDLNFVRELSQIADELGDDGVLDSDTMRRYLGE